MSSSSSSLSTSFIGSSSAALITGDAPAEESDRSSLGLALAKALNILEESRFNVGGLGVDSWLEVEGTLVFKVVELVVILDACPFAKKSFAVEG